VESKKITPAKKCSAVLTCVGVGDMGCWAFSAEC